MFTVKVCEGVADEAILEATSVRKTLTEGTAPDVGQIVVECADGGVLSYPIFDEQTQSLSGLPSRSPRTIYVMNRFGATVATYRI